MAGDFQKAGNCCKVAGNRWYGATAEKGDKVDMEAPSSGRVADRRSGTRRRVSMAIVLTVGMLAALTAFSGVGFAGNTHGTPAGNQYHPHH